MNQELRNCRSCKTEFSIKSDDLGFYKKMGVLPPALCSLCRARQRLAFRNERSFYRRKCDKCGKESVSMYSPNKPYTVWCHDCWFADDWNPLDYGREYDPSRPFFEQLGELWAEVPKVALVYVRAENSEYINISADAKNCYMIVESSNNENCIHCYWIQVCRDLVDVSFSHKTELSYECDDCYSCHKLFYSKGCHDCLDSYFLLDCKNCSNCIGCINLRSKQYHIFNEPVSQKEYETFVEKSRLDTYSGVEGLRKKFKEFSLTQPRKYAEIVNAPGCTGNYIKDAKNCTSCFHCYDAEDCKYGVHNWRNAKWCMDCDTSGRNVEFAYNSINTGMDSSNCICCSLSWMDTFMKYCSYCFNCNHCFGCIGLRKKNYCILNRQYDETSFKELEAHIIEGMKEKGEYGEFFPPSLSTFGYNEACVAEQFPLEKEEALRLGFKWEDYPRGTFGKESISWKEVPDSIDEVDKSIVKETFACESCGKNYLVIPNEFTFYKNLRIPLPRLCPDCRHTRRFEARGPNQLWPGKCKCAGNSSHFHGTERCPNEFQTSYAPNRPEIIYCEACYQSEVV